MFARHIAIFGRPAQGGATSTDVYTSFLWRPVDRSRIFPRERLRGEFRLLRGACSYLFRVGRQRQVMKGKKYLIPVEGTHLRRKVYVI
jgi:hypothetical protein